jgi:DNA-binding PadR family transcriptional regulator
MSTEDIVRAVLSQLAPSTARLLLQSMTEKHYLQSVLPSPAPDDKPEPLYQLTERAQQLLAALRAFAAALAKASATLAQQRSADVSDQDGRAAQPEIPAQLRTQLDRTLRLALSFGKPQRLLPTIGEFRVLTLLRAAHSEQSLDDIRSSLVSPPVEAELLSNLRSLRDKGLIASSTESRPPIICWSVSERGKPAAELLESLSSVLYTESGLPSKALLLMLLVLEHRPQGLRLVQLQELAERRIINSPALKSAVEKGYIQCDDLQDAPHAVYHISALGQQLLQLMRTLLRIKKEARSAAASPVTPAPRELSAQAAAYLALAQRLRELHKRLPQLAELQSMRWLAGAEERFRAQPQEPGAQSSPEHGLQQHVSRLRAAGYAEKRVVVRPLKTSTVMGLSSLGEQVLAILEPVCAALYPAGELLGMQEMLLLYVLHQTPQGLSGQQVVQALRTQVSADKVPTLLQSMIDTQYLQTVVPEATAGTVPQPSYQLTARAAELLARLQAFESTFPQAPRKPRTAASRRVSREAGVRAR